MADQANETRKKIMRAATDLFREKGLGFSMQDISDELHMAKKTIYRFYASKEELLTALLDYGFGAIHEEKARIIASDLPLAEKIRRVIIALPEEYRLLDFRRLDELYERYPAVGKKMNRYLEEGWEPVNELLDRGKKEGTIRDVSLPVLRMMITGAIESFLSRDVLNREAITYQEALDDMMDIIMTGITEETA